MRQTVIGLLCFVAGMGSAAAQTDRPRIGVAFGGGSARGIAHIGIIQWFEEHHVPIDVAAGTSMGGLVGGAYATGMSAAELRTLILDSTDWDRMFGSTSFEYKNVRRKEDARSYPSRLEFGLKRGIVPPPSLNNGQQVDLLLARICAAYYDLERFDDLPTPFRVVAVDLLKAERVVLDRGSLATALRATMSLPGVFPPVERDGRVLVDGGTLDNIPADVVKESGASVVIAVDVGYAPKNKLDYSMFGLLGRTLDVMMQTATRAALASSDLTIGVDVEGFGFLDWRRGDELIARGYQAAEKHRDELLKYRLSDEAWQAWLAGRTARRRVQLAQPTFLETEGIGESDAAFVRRMLARHLNQPIDTAALDRDLTSLSGLDRYETVDWRLATKDGATGLIVRAREKPYAPPFLMLGLNIENTTTESFRVQVAGRYLAYDVLGSGSELRVDAGFGADPNIAASLHRPLWATRIFVRPTAAVTKRTFSLVRDDSVVAQYRERRAWVDANMGVTLARVSEVVGWLRYGHVSDDVRSGDPGLPEMSGKETTAQLRWVYDSQDSPAIPLHGTRAVVDLLQVLETPEVPGQARTNRDLTQGDMSVASFFPVGRRHRVFVVASAGTSFDDHPLPNRQFTVGYPYRLDAFAIGDHRGDHYAVLTGGAMRQIARLPDFMGGPVLAGLWLQTGSVFNSDQNAEMHTQLGVGITMDTLVGPVLVGTSFGFDGGWRTIFGVGRIFR